MRHCLLSVVIYLLSTESVCKIIAGNNSLYIKLQKKNSSCKAQKSIKTMIQMDESNLHFISNKIFLRIFDRKQNVREH